MPIHDSDSLDFDETQSLHNHSTQTILPTTFTVEIQFLWDSEFLLYYIFRQVKQSLLKVRYISLPSLSASDLVPLLSLLLAYLPFSSCSYPF